MAVRDTNQPTTTAMRPLQSLLIAALAALPGMAQACWEDAERSEGVSAQLLYAVARVESNLNPRAVNRSHLARTKSYGIGMMQVESSNLPALRRRGITEAALFDPCTNIRVGASILAEKIARFGLTWEAVGAYNVACIVLKGQACRDARARYAWRVYRALSGLSPTVKPPRGVRRTQARPRVSVPLLQESLL